MSKIFVSVANHRYYFHPDDSPWEYEIEAEPEVLSVLDQLFDQKDQYEWWGFFRAHFPYVPYHLDPENDEVDIRLKKVYALIHEYGNEEAKKQIETMPYYS